MKLTVFHLYSIFKAGNYDGAIDVDSMSAFIHKMVPKLDINYEKKLKLPVKKKQQVIIY